MWLTLTAAVFYSCLSKRWRLFCQNLVLYNQVLFIYLLPVFKVTMFLHSKCAWIKRSQVQTDLTTPNNTRNTNPCLSERFGLGTEVLFSVKVDVYRVALLSLQLHSQRWSNGGLSIEGNNPDVLELCQAGKSSYFWNLFSNSWEQNQNICWHVVKAFIPLPPMAVFPFLWETWPN